MTLDELMLAAEGRITATEVKRYCDCSGLSGRDALSAAARTLARRYAQGTLDFQAGERLAGALFAYACMHIADMGLPECLESVVHSFDAEERRVKLSPVKPVRVTALS